MDTAGGAGAGVCIGANAAAGVETEEDIDDMFKPEKKGRFQNKVS